MKKDIVNKKDWVGNSHSVYNTNGCSNHSDTEREENDFYATDPKALDILFNEGNIKLPSNNILEPCAGRGHLSEKLKEYGYNVTSYDKIDRGYCPTKDFFDIKEWNGSIVTNPPYSLAKTCVEHALEIIPDKQYVVMFLKLTFLEGKARKTLFKKYPPKYVFVSSSRLECKKDAKLGDKFGQGAVAYCWFIWEKNYTGETIIKWIN